MDKRQYNLIPVAFATFQANYPEELDRRLNQFISDMITDYAVPVVEAQSMTEWIDDSEERPHITLNIRYKIVPKQYL